MKKSFTDLFIKRPVLATVVSLLILLLGLRSLFDLPVREYPDMKNTQIQVVTSYYGASAEVVQSFITATVSKAVASAAGVDYISSQSSEGVSTVTAHIRLNFNPNEALVNVLSQVTAIEGELPSESKKPVISKQVGDETALMYIGYSSEGMTQPQITDYLVKAVQPELETLPGVAQAEVIGTGEAAMRIWLEPKRMAAYGLTTTDVMNALRNNNFQSAPGALEGDYTLLNIDANTGVSSVKDFEQLVLKHEKDDSLVRLKDIAKVELGQEQYNASVIMNGQNAVFIGITATPSANPLTVINEVRAVLPRLEKQYPSILKGQVVYDATDYIRDSIKEVLRTIGEATLIVILVIFLFLGSLRTVAIPIVTIPLSLIGVCSLMLALGFSLNLLTLLAMVLAIGLVVDDAIVVVENIYRHIEEGKTAWQASLQGAREIATPVISMSLTLAAVYAPIGFLGGVTGALFTEFAITLAAAVLVSGVVALTLSPMMCSKILTHKISEQRFVQKVDRFFEKLKNRYSRLLTANLNYRPVSLMFAIIVMASCIFLALSSKKELAPNEDKGFLIAVSNAPEYANFNYLSKYTEQIQEIYKELPFVDNYFLLNGRGGGTQAISGAVMLPWNQRSISQKEAQEIFQNKLNQIPGIKAFAFPIPPLPGTGGGMPVQFVVNSVGNYELLSEVSEGLLAAARTSGLFMFIDSDLSFSKPSLDLMIDKNKAAALGVSMQDIGSTLAAFLGGNDINQFDMYNRSYKVIPQVPDEARRNPDKLDDMYVRSESGELVPLSSFINYKTSVKPNVLNQYQQLNSVTISGMMMPGTSNLQGLSFLKQTLEKEFPSGFGIGYTGQSRQLMEEGSGVVYVFFFALLIIYLVLAAQFESFRDPLIVLISVPMSISGALIVMNFGFPNPLTSLNIYSGIGLISLIGLISKHGILMVDFANKLQIHEGLSIHDAIIKAAALRLRPILMTTAAMVFGVMPLLIASGPGAVSRFDIGLVISSGMLIGTLFTLFVVPTMYTFLARRHQPIAE